VTVVKTENSRNIDSRITQYGCPLLPVAKHYRTPSNHPDME
jgi:hypothetical protein